MVVFLQLPWEVSTKICKFLYAKTDSRDPPSINFNTASDATNHMEGEANDYNSLRTTCRTWRDTCDRVRTSIRFHHSSVISVEPYLQKLPNLLAFTIFYSSFASDISASLTHLFTILPHLKSLILTCEVHENSSFMLQGHIDTVLQPWRRTLQRLEMTNIHGLPSNPHHNNGMWFVSELQQLRVLVCKNVMPMLRSQDLAECTGLLALSMSQADSRHDMALDLTALTSLTSLTLSRYVHSVELSHMASLQSLNCQNNTLNDLDVSTCPELQHLLCSDTFISELDLSACHNLITLDCSSAALDKLNVTSCYLLESLKCNSCEITEINLSTCSALKVLQCSTCKLLTLDLRACSRLFSLDASNSQQLSVVAASGLADLTEVLLQWSGIKYLNVNACSALRIVDCSKTPSFVHLDVGECSALVVLKIPQSGLEFVQLIDCVLLQELDCSHTPLKSLSLESCAQLELLNCNSTPITELDVSFAGGSLNRLWCECCPNLCMLCLEGCINLSYLHCRQSPLTHVNSLGCDASMDLWCDDEKQFGW